MLNAMSRHSPLVPLFRAITNGQLHLALSVSILLEYEEVAARQGGQSYAAKLMLWLSLVAQRQGTVLIEPQFQFRIVSTDPDDNKFIDCAIAAHADFVITDDAHYAPLANAGYKPQPISPLKFMERHLQAP